MGVIGGVIEGAGGVSEGGGGDFVGPASALDGSVVLFDGTTGKLAKDAAVVLSAFAKTILDDADAAAVRTTIGATGTIGGSTGATDNLLLRSDGAGGATLQNSVIAVTDLGLMSGNLSGVRNSAGGATLAAADSGKAINIASGGGADTVDLPAAPTVGTWFMFDIIGTDELTVQAQGGHVIRVGTSASSAGGTAKSSTQGSMLYVRYAAVNQWIGLSSGTWAFA